ncbi:tRNA (5-methylaminomethyl-2-thiouridine)(34)-methyltransferase MnmD [Alisedimentitalea sp. MJ-SS2]|uniref:tRNA (5-methylaminomethyl-2-thiouridine)(34)-methyltransferase MnmD n=1 Tax=Aliisedimentitalea sp. MJ-SS2 TaxID=3049795 RepID=UPI00291423A1|nr:tRNA (5-methylaminomethyl-2-thiouridine)(34)-methyltransferase MnmD [Alisedimentitalea sp. MJ-SS2]MDU8927729.1 tRNA (5-methylaminomethyl-2-thiouridine)(34)-methyltransferase MnmD [Alisedimentitalea sp. MJ-SS2]
MGQQAEIEWRDGKVCGQVPVSTRFDDPYFSLENGLDETSYVFLDGNDLPARFADGFHIAELGFGTGLNLLAALHLWRASGQSGVLHFTTFEAFPMAADDMITAQSAFPKLADLSAELAPHWQSGQQTVTLPDLHFVMFKGDARETLPEWQGHADAWFLDGFSPAKNPELWQADLMAQVGAHTAPGGTASTYTAAGFVRRGLQEAGFEVSRRSGFGRKRHMTVARMPKT